MAVGSPAPAYFPAGNANVGEVKTLFVKFISGNNGAVATLKNYSEVVSVTKTGGNGSGAYTIQFSQAYDHGQNLTGNIAQAAGYDATHACAIRRVYDTSESTNGTVKILTVNSAGAATDMLIGDVLELEFKVGLNSGTPS